MTWIRMRVFLQLCGILSVSLQIAVIIMMVGPQMLQVLRQGRLQAAGSVKMFIIMMVEQLCQNHSKVTYI